MVVAVVVQLGRLLDLFEFCRHNYQAKFEALFKIKKKQQRDPSFSCFVTYTTATDDKHIIPYYVVVSSQHHVAERAKWICNELWRWL